MVSQKNSNLLSTRLEELGPNLAEKPFTTPAVNICSSSEVRLDSDSITLAILSFILSPKLGNDSVGEC